MPRIRATFVRGRRLFLGGAVFVVSSPVAAALSFSCRSHSTAAHPFQRDCGTEYSRRTPRSKVPRSAHTIPSCSSSGPPLTGSDWVARSGPSNDSYHRRGILVFDGGATIDRRYAIDWVQSENGATFSGDALDTRSHYAYGEEVLAVADGRAIYARDGIPENVPGHDGFRPAVPLSMDTLAGNTITLDVGRGQFAYYMHLQPGSLRVRAGDRVRRGQVLARIGNSGDSREPHLHFEVTTSSRLLVGEGLPYVIDRYRGKSADDSWQIRTRELPLRDMVIDFGQAGKDK